LVDEVFHSPSFPRSQRQTSAAAALAVAALAALACTWAAPAAHAADARGSDADIPGVSTVRSMTSDAGPTAHVLERGAGYSSRTGSPAVRGLQRMLRALGKRPGPIDGLYGPLTQAAVERFQRTQGLAVDGVVGPWTGKSLVRRVDERRKGAQARAAERPGRVGVPDAVPSPVQGANPATDPVERSAESLSPAWAALIAGLALALLLTAVAAVRGRRREPARRGRAAARLNPGMAFACLLAVFVIGAAGGAVFVGQAAPDNRTATTADARVPAPRPSERTVAMAREVRDSHGPATKTGRPERGLQRLRTPDDPAPR
jgi:peptidoglycan hydrolase-like protein with peptidoglycan-binding domain